MHATFTTRDGLQSRIGDEITGEDLVAFGVEHNWEFTTDDLLDAAELSDEELERVAGGTFKVNGKNLFVATTRDSGSPDSRQLRFVGTSDGNAVKFRIRFLSPSDPRIL